MTPIARSLAFSLLFATACSGAQTPPPRRELTARDYFPLRASAAWSFDSVNADDQSPGGLVVMQVVRDDGAGGFYVRQGRGAPALYAYEEGGVTRNGELFLNNPIAAGTRWRGRSGDSYVIQQVGLDRTVTAGTFHNVIEVVHVAGDATLRNGTEYRETYYYAPNVGPIEALLPIILPNDEVRRFRLSLRGFTLDGTF